MQIRPLQGGWTKDGTITRGDEEVGEWVVITEAGEDYGSLDECFEAWALPLAGYSLRLVELTSGQGWELWSRSDEDGVWYSGAWWVLEVNREHAAREGLGEFVTEHPWMTREEAIEFRDAEVGMPCIAVQVGDREVRIYDNY